MSRFHGDEPANQAEARALRRAAAETRNAVTPHERTAAFRRDRARFRAEIEAYSERTRLGGDRRRRRWRFPARRTAPLTTTGTTTRPTNGEQR